MNLASTEDLKTALKEYLNQGPLDSLLEECKKAEQAFEMHNIGGQPTFLIKLYRPCPGKTAIPFFHGKTGPIVRGKVLFHGNKEMPSIVSISCKQFRKWLDWFRSRPTIDQIKEEIANERNNP